MLKIIKKKKLCNYLAQVSTVLGLGDQVGNSLGGTTARLGDDSLVQGLDGSVSLLGDLGGNLDTTTSTTDVNSLSPFLSH